MDDRFLSPSFPSTTSLRHPINALWSAPPLLDNCSSKWTASSFPLSAIDQGVEEDARIKVLKEWVEGKDCLDTGCNSGLITITIGN
ncbi:hypothetical protein LguiB_012878 [Lonicera macranthoides]